MIRAIALGLACFATPAAAETLRIATGGHFPPYIFNPATENATGLDKQLMDEICARGGFECIWVDLPMSDIFQALARGDVDVVTGGFGYSHERDALVDFTCPYVASDDNTGLFLGTREGIDLTTARIGVLEQSLFQTALERVGRNVVAYATEEEALAALEAGEVNAVFGSQNLSDLANMRGGFVKLGEYPTFSGGSVLGVSEDAGALRDELDRLLAKISADGTLSRLQMRWLGYDQGDVIARCTEPTALT